MSALLAYLELESAALRLDAIDQAAADATRDVMDRVWTRLKRSERALLDRRVRVVRGECITGLVTREPIRLPIDGVFVEPPEPEGGA